MTSPQMNAAQHYRAAEQYVSRASRVRSEDDFTPTNPAEAAHCVELARLHLDLARMADKVLAAVDTRRDPDWLEPGEGWPPMRGDIWSDTEGCAWAMEREQMVRIHDGMEMSVDATGTGHGPMRLVFRAYAPPADDPWGVPF